MKKGIRISFNAPVTLAFVIICFAATLLGIITDGRTTQTFFMTYHSSLTNPLTYLRFVTHVFGHQGWSHFINNASYLLLVGPMIEEKHGAKPMIMVILITAVLTGVVNYILFPGTALCGASGVVFAFIMLASFTSFRHGEIPLTVVLVAVIFLGGQIYDGLFAADNISNLSHILGGVVGGVAGYLLNSRGR